MKLADLPRTLRTAKHLHPTQLAWRLRYRIRGRFKPRLPAVPSAVGLREGFSCAPRVEKWIDVEDEVFVASLEHGVLRHLNQSIEIGVDRVDWCLGPRAGDRLWVVTLHYHEWALRLADIVRGSDRLGDRAASVLRHYLRRWIVDCDLECEGSRDLAWNSYAIATRLGAWCRTYDRIGTRGRAAWGHLDGDFRRSFWQQAAYLHDNLEFDLRANHLLRDAVGLAWAGRFCEGAEPDRWLQTATRLGVEQAREQVLSDGGHFELSPMYHLHAMEDILTLAHLVRDPAARQELRDTWMRMAELQSWLTHPDGNIPLLNDAALNGACLPEDMLRVGCSSFGEEVIRRVSRGMRVFEEFGVAVWHGERTTAFFDVGKVGPDCQPGHAHADSLTLECSVDGMRLFVDPGTLLYEAGAERDYDRSTAAHNTVCVDQQDSTETWHVFRVGRRARPVAVRREDVGPDCIVTAGHDGYRWTAAKPRHTREVCVSNGVGLRITDRVASEQQHDVRGGFLIDPGWKIAGEHADGWTLRRGASTVHVTVTGPADLRLGIARREYHPEFGKRIATNRVCWSTRSCSRHAVVVAVTPT